MVYVYLFTLPQSTLNIAEMMKDHRVKKTKYTALKNTCLFAGLIKMEINLFSEIDALHVLIQILFMFLKVNVQFLKYNGRL